MSIFKVVAEHDSLVLTVNQALNLDGAIGYCTDFDIAILTRRGRECGFAYVSDMVACVVRRSPSGDLLNDKLKFRCATMEEAVGKAILAGRKVLVANSVHELVKAMYRVVVKEEEARDDC